MQQQAQLIRNKCAEVFAVAKEKWPHLDFSKVGIRFDLKGRAAGMACRRGASGSYQYYMRFNADMLTRDAFDHVLNDTVPHEIAHIVCFMDPRLGRDHNYGWASVCRQLGGTGATRHKEDVVYGKGTTYEYTSTLGHKIRVSETVHSRIQRGVSYTLRGNKGGIGQHCAYSIVGQNGRTLSTPIEKKVATTPAATPGLNIVRTNVIGAPVQQPVVTVPQPGESKAAISRRIMLSGYRAGQTYEQIINAMIAANGYDRQLARGTFKANAPKVGIPSSFY